MREQKHFQMRDLLMADAEKIFKERMASNCLKHPGKACPLSLRDASFDDRPAVKPLKLVFGGPMCLPWARMGNKEGFSHPSVESLFTWAAQISTDDWDVAYIEEAPDFRFLLSLTICGSTLTPSISFSGQRTPCKRSDEQRHRRARSAASRTSLSGNRFAYSTHDGIPCMLSSFSTAVGQLLTLAALSLLTLH
jgi:hypothetical protein